jgi:hypothetical protein
VKSDPQTSAVGINAELCGVKQNKMRQTGIRTEHEGRASELRG